MTRKLPRCPVCGRALRSYWICCDEAAAEVDEQMRTYTTREAIHAWRLTQKGKKRRERKDDRHD